MRVHIAGVLNLVILLGCILLVAPLSSAQTVYYRFVNDDGVKVLNAILPPEFAKNGYEIVGSGGKVIEVVPPALTEEQKALLGESRKREAELAKWDESLLLTYSSKEDIVNTKSRRVSDFDASISILRANANNFRGQIQQAQGRAADAERAGRAVPQALLTQISGLQTRLVDTETQIEQREAEKLEMAKQYDMDIERFGEIKPEVGDQ